MFLPSLSLAVIGALTIWITECAAGCGDQQVNVKGRCCDKCPPGQYLTEFCSEHQQTVCSPCEEDHYSDRSHIFDRCEKCHICQQGYAEKCTPTTNAECSCHSGFLCSNEACSECQENKCVAGEKLKMTANSNGDYLYQCEPLCPGNEYFDVKEDVCKPWTQCSAIGLVERFPGNKTHNSVCYERHKNGGDFIHVILGIGFLLLSLTLLVILSSVCIKITRKHRAPNYHSDVIAVSTNTSEFHLSKEETGLQLIIQDESKNSDSVD